MRLAQRQPLTSTNEGRMQMPRVTTKNRTEIVFKVGEGQDQIDTDLLAFIQA
jgi:hypothetical protein